jgi:hypothetical protein
VSAEEVATVLLQVREIREKSGEKIGQGKVRKFENLVWGKRFISRESLILPSELCQSHPRASIREKLKFGQGKVREKSGKTICSQTCDNPVFTTK